MDTDQVVLKGLFLSGGFVASINYLINY